MSKKDKYPVEFTVLQAAKKIGCGKSSVQRRAVELELGRMVGNVRILSESDVKKIAKRVSAGKPGNPEFGVKYKGKARAKRG